MKRLATIAPAILIALAACAAPPAPTALPSATAPSPAASPAVMCVGVSDEVCLQMVALARAAYPAQVSDASRLIVADTCPPDSVCDRRYVYDAVVVVVPRDGNTENALLLRVFGQERPEQVAMWPGDLPDHVKALLP